MNHCPGKLCDYRTQNQNLGEVGINRHGPGLVQQIEEIAVAQIPQWSAAAGFHPHKFPKGNLGEDMFLSSLSTSIFGQMRHAPMDTSVLCLMGQQHIIILSKKIFNLANTEPRQLDVFA